MVHMGLKPTPLALSALGTEANQPLQSLKGTFCILLIRDGLRFLRFLTVEPCGFSELLEK